MNRSNTALENLFQKKYLEPEVYGKAKENFLTKNTSDDGSIQTPGSPEIRPGSVVALKRQDD